MKGLETPMPITMPAPNDGQLRVCYAPDWNGKNKEREYRFHCWGTVGTPMNADGVVAIIANTMAIIECYETGQVFTVIPEVVKFHRTVKNKKS